MTGPMAWGRPAAPQATQVVLVRGVPLPMPQPEYVENAPYSPTVTPESATLMRLAKSLARHQGTGESAWVETCMSGASDSVLGWSWGPHWHARSSCHSRSFQVSCADRCRCTLHDSHLHLPLLGIASMPA